MNKDRQHSLHIEPIDPSAESRRRIELYSKAYNEGLTTEEIQELLDSINPSSQKSWEILNITDEDIELSKARSLVYSKPIKSETDFDFLLGNISLEQYRNQVAEDNDQ